MISRGHEEDSSQWPVASDQQVETVLVTSEGQQQRWERRRQKSELKTRKAKRLALTPFGNAEACIYVIASPCFLHDNYYSFMRNFHRV